MRSMKWLMPALVVGLSIALSNWSAWADGPATKPSRGTGTLIVNVVGGDGKAVASANVIVATPLPGEQRPAGNNTAEPIPGRNLPDNGSINLGSMGHSRPVARGTTDANGSITFSSILAGQYHVSAYLNSVGRGFVVAIVTAGETETVTVTIGHGQPGPNH